MPKCDFNKVALQLLQTSRGVLKKSCSGNMHHIYSRTQLPKCDFNKVALQLLQPSRGVLKKSCSENMQQI